MDHSHRSAAGFLQGPRTRNGVQRNPRLPKFPLRAMPEKADLEVEKWLKNKMKPLPRFGCWGFQAFPHFSCTHASAGGAPKCSPLQPWRLSISDQLCWFSGLQTAVAFLQAWLTELSNPKRSQGRSFLGKLWQLWWEFQAMQKRSCHHTKAAELSKMGVAGPFGQLMSVKLFKSFFCVKVWQNDMLSQTVIPHHHWSLLAGTAGTSCQFLSSMLCHAQTSHWR